MNALKLILPALILVALNARSQSLSLNGEWEMGYGRNYTKKVLVPGIQDDATKMAPEKVWFRREVMLPKGKWSFATLELKGARFAPEVFVNGMSVSKQNGGMAPTFHLLNHKDVKPGAKITIEIALTSLKDLPPADASYIPPADQWRSNVSSCLWNDVELKLHGAARIDRVIPFTDFDGKKATIAFDLSLLGKENLKQVKAVVEVRNKTGKVLIGNTITGISNHNKVLLSYGDLLKPWSPSDPNVYRLNLSIIKGRDTIDHTNIPFGAKDFRITDKQFFLNNQHITLLGGTTVWHRWVRDQESRTLGYDRQWFIDNVILRLKAHGANYIRFHLGMPPEFLLDLCDEYGLAVQYEWSFFHGMPATRESLMEQYPRWLDVAMRHPSVMLYHPYNETEGDQLGTVWSALDEILKNYPPLVMEERDVIHVHKYWWSLFENLGLYYDSYQQFPKTIMVDEFGGNYLDGDGNMGGYSTIPETYLRFLGRNHTRESRLAFHAMANGKVAEYWRRIGAAGAAPFCMLGSWNDGNHWFLGKLTEGKPKPVWNALSCAWSPQSVSLNIWDRNFVPGQEVEVPLYLFNDTPEKGKFQVKITLKNSSGNTVFENTHNYTDVSPFFTRVEQVRLKMPDATGKYSLSAELVNRPAQVKYPVVSSWDVNVFKAVVPTSLSAANIRIACEEPELTAFLKAWGLKAAPLADSSANMIVLSKVGWEQIAKADRDLLARLEKAINKGTSVILLDAGDRYLGQGYPREKGDLGPLQGVVRKSNTPVTTYCLFGGIKLSFSEAAEPESHIHPDKNNAALWNTVPYDHTWLWNGMRGGLIVPATNMEFSGLSSTAFLEQWKARGADEAKIKAGSYYAYELEGFYEFSNIANDNTCKDKLKKKVVFLMEDAPALASSLNPNAPVMVTNLSKGFTESANGMGESLEPLVNAGKNLTRTPVLCVNFGKGKGKLIVSQLLTAGRLAPGFGEKEPYGIRCDEVANQLVLNMMDYVNSR